MEVNSKTVWQKNKCDVITRIPWNTVQGLDLKIYPLDLELTCYGYKKLIGLGSLI